MCRPLGVDEISQPLELSAQDLLIEKQQRRERLVLGRRTHFGFGRQIRKVGADLRLAHSLGMAFVVKQDEPANPASVGLLRSRAVVSRAKRGANEIQQARP